MSKAQDRYAQYYQAHAKHHPEDWQWFDLEWQQIRRAWESADENYDLVLDYLETMSDFMKARGLLRDLIQWEQKGAEFALARGQSEARALLLNNIALCHQELGEQLQALETYEIALTIRRETGDKRGEIQTLINIGHAFYEG